MSAGSAQARRKRLPAGRHGLPRDLVREDQRRRMMAAAAECLAERGYGHITTTEVAKRASVSTSTFYQQFGDLWACLLATYEDAAERLCAEIGAGCETGGTNGGGAEAAIANALALFIREPALARLLAAEPPPRDAALTAARARLGKRLVALLRNARGGSGGGEREAHLVSAALTLVATRARAKSAKHLPDLAPVLTRILLAPAGSTMGRSGPDSSAG